MNIYLDWQDFKLKVAYTKKIRYEENSSFYKISYHDIGGGFDTSIIKDGNPDQIDFEQNYKANSNGVLDDLDQDGRQVGRIAAGAKGATYLALFFEITTSSGQLVIVDEYGNDISDYFSVQRFDSSGTPTTSNTDCVQTRVTYAPPFDYEIVSGTLRSCANITQSLYVGVVGGATDLGPAGVKGFVRGLDLKYVKPGSELKTDGRAAKYMKHTTVGVPTPTNKLQFILKHTAGTEHSILFAIEIFR